MFFSFKKGSILFCCANKTYICDLSNFNQSIPCIWVLRSIFEKFILILEKCRVKNANYHYKLTFDIQEFNFYVIRMETLYRNVFKIMPSKKEAIRNFMYREQLSKMGQ